MRRIAMALVLALAATAATAQSYPEAELTMFEPDLGVDPRFFTTSLEADMGLVPRNLRLWYLPPLHAADLPPQAYAGRYAGRLFLPRGNSPWEFVFDPYLAGFRTRRLYFPTGHFARLAYRSRMDNRGDRLLIVDRDHEEPYDPEWEGSLHRVANLKAVADVELRAGRPLRAAIAYGQQVSREPDDAMARLGLSDALLLLENHDLAGEAAREAIRAEPRLLRVRIDKRGFLDDPEPLDRAIDGLRRTLERLPGSAYERFLLGYNLLFTGRPGEAVEHLEAAAEAWPWDPVPRMALRTARERAGS